MTEREKIAQLLCKQTGSNENRECETCPFNGCIAQRQADALIAAGIGDVVEWKGRAEKAEERLKKLKKTEGDLTVEEEISILENLLEEAKHRSFVFERELVKYKKAFDNTIKAFHETLSAFFPDEEIDLDKWKKQNLANAEKQLAEEEKYEKY